MNRDDPTAGLLCLAPWLLPWSFDLQPRRLDLSSNGVWGIGGAICNHGGPFCGLVQSCFFSLGWKIGCEGLGFGWAIVIVVEVG